jgi:hypothetical protein
LFACQTVELGIEPPGCELLRALDLLPAFPPIGFVRGFGDRLRAGFLLGNLCPVRYFIFLA